MVKRSPELLIILLIQIVLLSYSVLSLLLDNYLFPSQINRSLGFSEFINVFTMVFSGVSIIQMRKAHRYGWLLSLILFGVNIVEGIIIILNSFDLNGIFEFAKILDYPIFILSLVGFLCLFQKNIFEYFDISYSDKKFIKIFDLSFFKINGRYIYVLIFTHIVLILMEFIQKLILVEGYDRILLLLFTDGIHYKALLVNFLLDIITLAFNIIATIGLILKKQFGLKFSSLFFSYYITFILFLGIRYDLPKILGFDPHFFFLYDDITNLTNNLLVQFIRIAFGIIMISIIFKKETLNSFGINKSKLYIPLGIGFLISLCFSIL